jgi:NAD+-dependent protein deacetylase sirtuin 2
MYITETRTYHHAFTVNQIHRPHLLFVIMKVIVAPVDLPSLAKWILSPECRSIALLTGAGVSVASGIPDFRSPGGMYATLRPELLTATPEQRRWMEDDPTYVVSWDIFRENQFPYLEVRRPFILGTRNQQWKATIAHRFAELVHTKIHKLTRVYTQNIDGLDRQCQGIPDDKIVNIHGSIAQVACEGCGADLDLDDFCRQVEANIKNIYEPEKGPSKSTPVECPHCGQALVKPKTVLFGRSLPEEFFIRAQEDMPSLDLLIVAGTSLVVSPANSLVRLASNDAKRVIINTEPVGADLGIDYSGKGRDFFAQGECDHVFLELISELGWLDDLVVASDTLPETSRVRLQTKLG